MKYNVQNCINFMHFVLVQGQVNTNFQLVLNTNVPVGQVGHGISTALVMVLYSPDLTNIGFSFILLTVNLFHHPTLIEHGTCSTHNKD